MYITDENAINVVNQLFEKLTVIMPAFKQSWPNEDDFKLAKKEWVIAFQDAKINSIDHLKRGIDRFRLHSNAFIPSPGQFIKMCKATAEDVGAPPLEKAFYEVCNKYHPSYGSNKNWSHPCVEYAAKAYGSQIHLATNRDMKNKFEPIYLDAIEQYSQGRIMQQIENKKKDTIENRIKHQEVWGGMRLPNTPSYFEWLLEQ